MKSSPALKFLAFLLCVLTAAAAFWGGVLSMMYWEEMWTEADYFSSSQYYNSVYDMTDCVEQLLNLYVAEQTDGLTYAQQEQLSTLQELLAPENTNYRFQLRENATGVLLASNTESEELDSIINRADLRVLTIRRGYELSERDYIEYDVMGEYDAYSGYPYSDLYVWTGEEYLVIKGSESLRGYNEYGWYYYSEGRYWDDYSASQDCRVIVTEYALTSGVLADLPVDDEFRAGRTVYGEWQYWLPKIIPVTLVCIVVFLITLAYLFCTAGHRKGTDEIVFTWADHVPLDVLGVGVFFLLMLVLSMGSPIAYGMNWALAFYRLAVLYTLVAVLAAAVLGFLLSTAVRLKAGKFWDSILTWRVCVWTWHTLGRLVRAIGQGAAEMSQTVSMNVRLGLVFGFYLLVNAVLAWGFFLTFNTWFYLFGLVSFNGVVFLMACRWVRQWRTIRAGTSRIVGGDPTIQIDTRRMYGDLREHAEQLNDLGTAINHAVDERLKSEHFKAELITNVSHDLKTPLTSIINYVDLLKKLDIDDPTAKEYLEVLDRKGQRLKKLTEDLVEASKASTGNVTVNADRMDLVQFTQQAAAEYEDRLAQQGLTVISKMPEQPLYISADGRHMWRILDNLLNNCAKYAMEGTRVYLEVVEWDGKASISLKNISREALNLSPEELTERFVRGDESRTTEGSGLGLSIARSLTEVQGGTFRLTTDGDLFKVTVYFPVLAAPAQI